MSASLEFAPSNLYPINKAAASGPKTSFITGEDKNVVKVVKPQITPVQ
ncbi:unnamed protein product, partial [Rotaria sp. Silwood1]